MILDGGSCSAGLESTIVAVRDNGWQILRPGPVTSEDIENVIGYAPLAATNGFIEAPGQMASHYAPSKPVRLNVIASEPDVYLIGFGAIAGDDNLSATGDLAQAAAPGDPGRERGDDENREIQRGAEEPDQPGRLPLCRQLHGQHRHQHQDADQFAERGTE